MNNIIVENSSLKCYNINTPSHRHNIFINEKMYQTDPNYETTYSSTLSLGFHILSQLGINIVRRELSGLDINLEEISNLLNSKVEDDYLLAISILEAKEVKYSINILKAIKYENPWELNNYIELFNRNNQLNIGNKIK